MGAGHQKGEAYDQKLGIFSPTLHSPENGEELEMKLMIHPSLGGGASVQTPEVRLKGFWVGGC